MKIQQYRRQSTSDEYAAFEKRKKKNHHNHDHQAEKDQRIYREQRENGFTCVECRFPVSVEREVSGVINRNHCPRCLYSRHVDEFKAGDRKATCRSRMEPIGLTIKHSPKRYGGNLQGELMLIHRCKGCGKISINRIAADDDAARLYQLFNESANHAETWKDDLENRGIHVLGLADLTAVYSRLFGWQAILEEFTASDYAEDPNLPIPQDVEETEE